jgi:hypothetical protein
MAAKNETRRPAPPRKTPVKQNPIETPRAVDPVRSKEPQVTQIDREAIARRAYERYLQRGRIPGHEQEDWLEAERELKRQG